MTDRNALTQQIASILDYPSVYMGAPSNRSLRYAEKIVGLFDERIAAARAEALEEAAKRCEELSEKSAIARMRESDEAFTSAAWAIRTLAQSAAQGDKT
jgi:hypothetical protein